MRWLPAITAAFCLAVTATGALAQKAALREIVRFEDLTGWAADDHQAALEAFIKTCGDLKDDRWSAVCKLAKTKPDARRFFELFFVPMRIQDGKPGLVTGYYEPELQGSKWRTPKYRYPVYRKPAGLTDGQLWYDRRTILTGNVMNPRDVIVWVKDQTALFYLQVQGSGRVRLRSGEVIRLGYAASNGRKFKSPGQELVRRGIYKPHQVSAAVVGNWVNRNPVAGTELLMRSPGYVFFRKIKGMGPEDGPRGAMNRSITAGRTLAVDPAFVPLGAPVWLEKGGGQIERRLMIAQDTGSAIKGAQRADFFTGSGAVAGRAAAKLNDPARLIILLPIDLAYAVADG